MPAWRGVVERFLPAAAAGAAGVAGVPADRAADRSAELAPVLDALAETQDEA
jgi:hypothetical protein